MSFMFSTSLLQKFVGLGRFPRSLQPPLHYMIVMGYGAKFHAKLIAFVEKKEKIFLDPRRCDRGLQYRYIW
jgi:hypothetical protein